MTFRSERATSSDNQLVRPERPDPPGHRQLQWGATLISVICDNTGYREIRIVMNRNGTFGFEEWVAHWDDYVGYYWAPEGHGRTFADTAETAEREARASVDWLASCSEPAADG